MLRLRSLIALVPMALVGIACSSTDESPPAASSTESQLAASPRDPGAVAEAARGPKQVCATCQDDPFCSFSYVFETAPTTAGAAEAQAALGCGPVYNYKSGANAGILGFLGSFCPDTPASRKYLREHGFHGYTHDNFCDQCLNVPCGKVFVAWEYFIGPGCPSGCRIGSAPPPI